MDYITFYISIISALIAVFSFGFSLFTYHKSAIHDRKQATLDAYNLLQVQALDNLSSYSTERIMEIVQDRRSEEYRTVSRYIARIEHFCVGVNQNIYDRYVVYELAHGFLDGAIRKRIAPVLERKNYNGNGEDFYANTNAVMDWMDSEAERRKTK